MTTQTLERRAFNTKEAAQQLGLSENVVRREMREGRLPHVRVGRRVLISDRAISLFLDGAPKGSPSR